MSKTKPAVLLPAYPAMLELQRLTLPLYVGVTEEERKKTQDIHIDITFFYTTLPKGCETDEADDVICYDQLSKALRTYCKGKHFHLLEHLCIRLHRHIRETIANEAIKLQVRVEKPSPPMEEKLERAAFVYSDAV